NADVDPFSVMPGTSAQTSPATTVREPPSPAARLTKTRQNRTSAPRQIFRISLEMWTERHPLLRAFGDVLASWLLFGGVALASYTSHFAQEIGSTLLGLLAVFFTRSYA